MCAALTTGVWWILPLFGFVMCLAFLVMAFRFARTGSGCMCMGGHRGMPDDQVAQTGHEVKAEASR